MKYKNKMQSALERVTIANTILQQLWVMLHSGVARPGPTRACALPSVAQHDSRDSIKIRKYSSYSSRHISVAYLSINFMTYEN